jgi:hypothetical protein
MVFIANFVLAYKKTWIICAIGPKTKKVIIFR